MMATNRRPFTAHTNQAHADALRKRELGHIHQGKATLGWNDDDYRYHLRHLTGKGSASELDAAGRTKVLAHMAILGYTPKTARFQPFDQAAKIKWLWRKVGEHGGLVDASPAALLLFVGRQIGTGVSDVKFLSVAQASNVIEALKAMLDRAKRAQAAGGAHHG
jgi:hypothetical protein